MSATDEPLSTDAQPAPHHGRAPARPPRQSLRPSRASLSSAPKASPGSTWTSPTRRRAAHSPSASAGTQLDLEDVLSKRQRPEDRRVPRVPLRRPPFPVYDKTIQRLNAAELDVFLGPDYLVTLPNVELLPGHAAFTPLRRGRGAPPSLFSKGSGYLLYDVLDDLFDYCFPILDKIGHKLDSIEDDVFEGRAEEVVRDISNAKQEIISYRKIIKPERSTLRLLERQNAALPARGARGLLRRHRRRRRADLGLARQLQGGRRGPRADERVGALAPVQRRAAHPHRVQHRLPACDA